MAIHPELAPIAFIACISSLLPLPWHWRARNVATLSIVFWFFVSNLIFGVNAAVWADNVIIRAEVWCDISSKLVIGANIGLPAACLCIAMYLEQVASLRRATNSLADRRRRQWFEAFMGFGLPVIFMGLHFVVQGHRFDIIEGYGCRPATYYSIPSIFIVWLPPLLMAAGCFIFSGLALRHFVLRRLTFATHLQQSNSALTTSRYLRLIAMAIVQMIGVIGLTAYTMWFTNIAVPIRPWTTWDDVHSDFKRVDVFYARFYPKPAERAFYGMWIVVPLSTFAFVTFFAFGRDAVEEYKKCIKWVGVKVFCITKSDGNKKLDMQGPKFSFIKFPSSSPKPAMLPTSKPVPQSITSFDYTLPPYDTLYQTACMSTTFGSMSSTEKADTIVHDSQRRYPRSNSEDDDNTFKYEYKLRDSFAGFTNNITASPTQHSFKIQQPKAVGSYSDPCIYSPSSTVIGHSDLPKAKEEFDVTLSPLNTMASSHPQDHYAPRSGGRAPSTPLPVPQPTHEPVHAPTTMGSRLRPLLLMGRTRDLRRPVAYPSHAEERSAESAEGRS